MIDQKEKIFRMPGFDKWFLPHSQYLYKEKLGAFYNDGWCVDLEKIAEKQTRRVILNFIKKFERDLNENQKNFLLQSAEGKKEARTYTRRGKRRSYIKEMEEIAKTLPEHLQEVFLKSKACKELFVVREIFDTETILDFFKQGGIEPTKERFLTVVRAILENYKNRGIVYKWLKYDYHFETFEVIEKALNGYARHNLTFYDASIDKPADRGYFTEEGRDALGF